MIIYQLHEMGGDPEYGYDNIIGSYLRKERAEEEKAKAETKEKKNIERGNLCFICPFLEEPFHTINELLEEYSDYCSNANLIDTAYGISCLNYYTHWDDSTFYIEEVEVEE